MRKIFICSDCITGIFSAIYEAWKVRNDLEKPGVVLRDFVEQAFFCEYIEVEENEKKTIAVENLIKRHLSYDVYWDVYHAVLADDREKGNAILGMMLEARKISNSKKIMQHLSHPDVRKVFELSRKVVNEAHYYKEIVRFSELDNGILLSQIEPKNQILTCLGDHFENRFPLENWMIYDKTHRTFLVHEQYKRWILVVDEELNEEMAKRVSCAESVYVQLWKGFFENISITERESYERQRQHLPLRYRKYVTEFQ